MPAFVDLSDWIYYKGALCPHRAQSPQKLPVGVYQTLGVGRRLQIPQAQSEVGRTITIHVQRKHCIALELRILGLEDEKGREGPRKVHELRQRETGHSGKMELFEYYE